MNIKFIFPKREFSTGLTLIELLISIAISTILIGVVLFTLQTSLDTYHYVQDELFLQRVLDETLQVVSDGDFEQYGVKDSLEILRAETHSITFVPPWVDEGYFVKETVANKQKFYLSRPFKAGASLPIGEVLVKQKNVLRWRQYPIVFYLKKGDDLRQPNAYVTLNAPAPLAAKVRFVYRPDVSFFPDGAMTIQYQNGVVSRRYKGKKENILRHGVSGVRIEEARFRYFDNTNTEVLPDPVTGVIATAQIPNITAMKLSVKVIRNNVPRTGSVFINLRNTFASGAGLILREGTRINIPDSDDIRVLSLLNLIGVKDGGRVILEARSEEGQSWRINIELKVQNGKGVIHRYSLEYPSGRTVYAETIDLPLDQSLNFLTLGTTGRYDYDSDEGVEDVVNLKGKVKLTVDKMDAAGAALLVRP